MNKVTKKILAFNSNRNAEIVKIKYGFISQDVFRFYRGTCHLFYEDLAKKVRWKDDTKCCITGDLHLENFGTYKGDNRVVYFDMNDFDEALMAPATWEISRLLTSVYLAGHILQFSEKLAEELCHIYTTAYINVLENGKPIVIEKETATGLLEFFLERVQHRQQKEFIRSRIEKKNGHWKIIVDKEKTLPCMTDEKEKVAVALNDWLKKHLPGKKLQVQDVCYRIAGTGSVGIERYAALVYEKAKNRFHLVDIKEAAPSSLLPYSVYKQPAWQTEADRVVTLQKMVQHVSPAFLHTIYFGNKSFVVKELQPTQDRMDLALCKGKKNNLSDILVTMAEVTASGQLRSGGRQGSSITDDLLHFAANCEAWKKPLLQYAKKYAKQVVADYNSYKKDFEKGLVVKPAREAKTS